MEMTVHNNIVTNYQSNSNQATTIANSNTSFSDFLSKEENKVKIKNTPMAENKLITDKLKAIQDTINNLPAGDKAQVNNAIDKLNRIFGVNLLDPSGEFIKDNGTLDIRRLLDKYGKDIPYGKLGSVDRYINVLYKNGLIDNDDYFYAIKWLELKYQVDRSKVQLEKIADSDVDLVLKHKFNK